MKICNQIIILLIFSIIFSNDNPLDQTLGRDKDPKIAEDLSKVQLFMRKAKWGTINLFGSRFIARLVFPKETISYFDIDDKVVAFTVDDGFCGVDNIQGDMTEDVRKLFKKYDARATFFTSGSHCSNTSKSNIVNLLEDGHELANHGMYDWPYNKYTKEQFLNDFNQTTENTTQRSATSPVEQFTEKLNYRLRGRSFALRIDSTSLGTKYKLGTPRVDIRQDGRR